MAYTFLTLSEILRIHDDQISRYGGSPGTRDMGLLQSSLAMPYVQYEGKFLHENIFEMAAAYLFHIILNHPFIDGNKRTATVASLVFLEMNKVHLEIDGKMFEDLVISVAEGKTTKGEIADFLRKACKMSK